MSDNATTGTTGLTIAADEVTDATLGTVKVQYVKIMSGTLDSTAKMVVDSHGSMQATMVDSSGNAVTFNANGSATSANSAPIVPASDWIGLMGGDVAKGTSDSGKPLKIGGIGRTTNPSTVADGQRVDAIFDKLGKQIVQGSIRELKVNSIATSSTTTETAILSPVASTFLDLYGFIATNTSTQAVQISVKDSSGGTTQFAVAVPSGDTRGFMLQESAAINQGTVNKAWTTTLSTALTQGFITVTGLAVKNV